MNWIVARIKWLMLVAGVLTCSAFYAAVRPEEAVDFLFGRSLESAFSQLIVSDWAALVGLMGAMLVYAAFFPRVRMLAITVAGSGKLAFLGLMLWRGRQFLDEKVSIVLGLDVALMALFVVYAVKLQRMGTQREPTQRPMPSPAPAPAPAPRADQAPNGPTRPAFAKPGNGATVPRPPSSTRTAA